jgi:hypothetical protein
MLARLAREKAGKRTREIRRWASMLADVGLAILLTALFLGT